MKGGDGPVCAGVLPRGRGVGLCDDVVLVAVLQQPRAGPPVCGAAGPPGVGGVSGLLPGPQCPGGTPPDMRRHTVLCNVLTNIFYHVF